MKINGAPTRTLWPAADGSGDVEIFDQTLLPHRVEVVRLKTLDHAARAIKDMQVRGAPLIGATAAYGLALVTRGDHTKADLEEAGRTLKATRPTAVNLAWAVDRMLAKVLHAPPTDRREIAYAEAAAICDEDVETCRAIGRHGLALIEAAREKKGGGRVNVLTHCNAGWLACVDWGTAIAPIYAAQQAGIDVHVWVDETRPRNQGASLTAFELGQQGVAHTIIADNTGGHLMQHGQVDLCIVGTDRTTRTGDVANKIGTYLKALAAQDNGVPFYVALPGSTIDWTLTDGIAQIPIEQRDPTELTRITGRLPDGSLAAVDIAAPGSPAANYGFDVTPARLVTGLITERGVCAASEAGLVGLYPERGR
ncbi:S-methyl-5-thioribose-1-phosphate isomerase [Phenylobacterium montanum]|uniref:Methylthioribose-1-phosphate isomerase n=1 Tax=Phenylobacterium montanum TaxID=2823693 RepID=A0A975IWD5_9CAUL|nr:S-methyl-5-thioribose-1-phosphate isomerase [Caulobacter sp. S6]QUD89957.1 S-methyl-5-thioribose-1-phosphate isomerase [Caulobacter sp. S6]